MLFNISLYVMAALGVFTIALACKHGWAKLAPRIAAWRSQGVAVVNAAEARFADLETRLKAIEGPIAVDLAGLKSRATSIENIIATDLASLKSHVASIESTIATRLADFETRLKAIEGPIAADIPDLKARVAAADESIKKLLAKVPV